MGYRGNVNYVENKSAEKWKLHYFIRTVNSLLTYLLNYLLTYLLTPWNRVLLEKLTGSVASQEIPRILWNTKVHYRTSQVPATCSYPEPIPSSLHPLPLPEDPS